MAASPASDWLSLAGLLLAWQTELRIGGGLFLFYLGWRTWRTPPAEQAQAPPTCAGLAGDDLSILALTATNPVTILAFLGIFAGLRLAAPKAGILRRRDDWRWAVLADGRYWPLCEVDGLPDDPLLFIARCRSFNRR